MKGINLYIRLPSSPLENILFSRAVVPDLARPVINIFLLLILFEKVLDFFKNRRRVFAKFHSFRLRLSLTSIATEVAF